MHSLGPVDVRHGTVPLARLQLLVRGRHYEQHSVYIDAEPLAHICHATPPPTSLARRPPRTLTSRLMWSRLPTWHTQPTTSRPSALSAATVSSTLFCRRELTTTWAPSRANRRTMPSPMPAKPAFCLNQMSPPLVQSLTTWPRHSANGEAACGVSPTRCGGRHDDGLPLEARHGCPGAQATVQSLSWPKVALILLQEER